MVKNHGKIAKSNTQLLFCSFNCFLVLLFLLTVLVLIIISKNKEKKTTEKCMTSQFYRKNNVFFAFKVFAILGIIFISYNLIRDSLLYRVTLFSIIVLINTLVFYM